MSVIKLPATMRGVAMLPVHKRPDRVRALLQQAHVAERDAVSTNKYRQAEAHRRYLAGLLSYVEAEEMKHAAE